MLIWQPAYIGVGSNLGEPLVQVTRAVQQLRALPDTRVGPVSRWYRSVPLGSQPQPDFVNGVVGVLTRLTAGELLGQLQAIETQMGRPARHEHWGPRIIDLDLLVFAQQRCAGPALILPHPGVVQRNFVLYPLADIAPDLEVPGLGRVAELKGRLTPTGLQVL